MMLIGTTENQLLAEIQSPFITLTTANAVAMWRIRPSFQFKPDIRLLSRTRLALRSAVIGNGTAGNKT